MEPYSGEVSYRGQRLRLEYDEFGDQMTLTAFGETIGLGVGNTQFLEDAKSLVDCRLDAIAYVRGARLERFDNAGHRDARLTLRGRILKVWTDRKSDSELTEESKRVLEKLQNR